MPIPSQSNVQADDIRTLGAIFSFKTPEFTARLVILTVSAILMTFFMGYPIFVYWLLAYTLALALTAYLVHRLTVDQTRRVYRAVITSELVSTSIFIALPIYLWSQPGVFLNFAGTALILGALLNSFTQRSTIRELAIIDGVTNSIIIIYLGALFLGPPEIGHVRWVGPIIAAGTLAYYVTVLRDVFGLRRTTLEVNRRSLEAQKMEAVGRLTGGVAHDFNNILTVVMGNLDLYREIKDQKERDELVESSLAAAGRASKLVSHLLAFSRKSVLLSKAFDIHVFLDEFMDLARGILPDVIEADVFISPDTPAVKLDRNQLENALLNLVINARDAMPAGGKLTISVRPLSKDDFKVFDLPKGRYVTIEIADTGRGIPSDILSRVFDPFFTTKPIGEGSGLGLSMAHGFVEQSGGQIRIESAVDRGTKITLILPALADDEMIHPTAGDVEMHTPTLSVSAAHAAPLPHRADLS
ncbi:sensor histidine kinase [Litoreibacter roseus]|uniref:sensor histidine kinase n=1 Tax=Litoreibacter roseus TaxID=2601869 RepID=UPI0013595364|nr:ATP-binding protein [Litoreibacter roseus]